jgi:hypothetical protein
MQASRREERTRGFETPACAGYAFVQDGKVLDRARYKGRQGCIGKPPPTAPLDVYGVVQSASDACRVPAAITLPGVSPWRRLRPWLSHLRHSAATLLLSAGVHVKVASEMLGHSTARLTLDVYSHVLEGMQAEAAATMERSSGSSKHFDMRYELVGPGPRRSWLRSSLVWSPAGS